MISVCLQDENNYYQKVALKLVENAIMLYNFWVCSRNLLKKPKKKVYCVQRTPSCSSVVRNYLLYLIWVIVRKSSKNHDIFTYQCAERNVVSLFPWCVRIMLRNFRQTIKCGWTKKNIFNFILIPNVTNIVLVVIQIEIWLDLK